MIGGFYYTMSPYQNCIRAIDKRIEDVRNQLATETDVTKRDELELENKDLISQKKSDCSDYLYLMGFNLIVHKNITEENYAIHTKYYTEIQRKLKAAKIETELVYCDWENIEEITRVARDLILQESSNEVAINLPF